MLNSLVVLTNTGDTLLERHYQESLRSIVDNFIRNKDQLGLFSNISNHICIKVEVNDVIFLGITGKETFASVAIEMIYILVDVIKTALNKCDSEAIRDRFSGVLMVIDELFDHGGPFTAQTSDTHNEFLPWTRYMSPRKRKMSKTLQQTIICNETHFNFYDESQGFFPGFQQKTNTKST